MNQPEAAAFALASRPNSDYLLPVGRRSMHFCNQRHEKRVLSAASRDGELSAGSTDTKLRLQPLVLPESAVMSEGPKPLLQNHTALTSGLVAVPERGHTLSGCERSLAPSRGGARNRSDFILWLPVLFCVALSSTRVRTALPSPGQKWVLWEVHPPWCSAGMEGRAV